MITTIQVSTELQQELANRKLIDTETYEDVIWGALEDSMGLSDETIKDIAEAREDIKAGRVHTAEEVYRELGL